MTDYKRYFARKMPVITGPPTWQVIDAINGNVVKTGLSLIAAADEVKKLNETRKVKGH
jgi:hypothetical protein